MAKLNRGDFRQLQKLKDNLEKLQSADMQKFCQDTSKELAARLLSLVIPATPVGDYSREITVTAKRDGKRHKKGETYIKRVNTSGKNGGTLRRGWTAKTHLEAVSGQGRPNVQEITEYAQNLNVAKSGDNYTVEVINPVEYASYVEYGHRTPNGKGWVKGQYFLTDSEAEIEHRAPRIIKKKLDAKLREAFKP